ncbi:MAG: glycosyltransferase family 4 protein [Gammaproteobacteria bacterium]|nr:glycosyltransferase family 4 protein [Gammaproteobacteria bacterium]
MQAHETLRVGYVVKRYPRYSETFIVNEILAHEEAGLDIEIFALRGPEDTHFQDIISRVRAPVTYLPDRLQKTSDFWGVLRDAAKVCPKIWPMMAAISETDAREIAHGVALAAHAVERGITHLHAHFATSAATAARIASLCTGIPYSFTAHAKDIFHESVDSEDLAAKINAASAVITVSDFNVDFLNENYDIPHGRLRRIYNGLDLTRFPYAEPQNRPPVIVSVGRLVEKKGFEYLIDACALLQQRGTDFRCIIVGSGEFGAQLQQRIQEQGLGDTVLLMGSRPQREVIELVQGSAVFAAPCVVGDDGNRDGLPTVVLEAMALGTPCIGTDVTGLPEVLIDNVTGLRVDQRDADGLADAIGRLLHDGEARLRLSRAARQLIETLFNVRPNAAAVRELFKPASNQPLRRMSA